MTFISLPFICINTGAWHTQLKFEYLLATDTVYLLKTNFNVERI